MLLLHGKSRLLEEGNNVPQYREKIVREHREKERVEDIEAIHSKCKAEKKGEIDVSDSSFFICDMSGHCYFRYPFPGNSGGAAGRV